MTLSGVWRKGLCTIVCKISMEVKLKIILVYLSCTFVNDSTILKKKRVMITIENTTNHLVYDILPIT